MAKIKNKKDDSECDDKCDCKCCRKARFHHKGCGAVYFLGFIGAAIYYIGHATGFWNGVLGFLKACVWPVFLVLKILGM